MVRGADGVITCSAYMREHVADAFGIAAGACPVIPNGIDPTDLQPVADLPRLRAQFARPDEKLVLLVGRLVYEKGFHLALDALPRLIERLGGVRFLVAGSGTAEAELKAQARELGLMEHGTFIGWTGDDVLHSLYRIADLCLVPSIYEPFGLVALEAMASGCPLHRRRHRRAARGRARPGSASACASAPATPSSLARMAQKLLTDDALRDRLVAQAREHVLQFDWADVARQTAAVYDELRGAARSERRGGGLTTGAPAPPGRRPRRRSRPRRRRRRARPTARRRGRRAARGPPAARCPPRAPSRRSRTRGRRTGADQHAALAQRRAGADRQRRRRAPRSARRRRARRPPRSRRERPARRAAPRRGRAARPAPSSTRGRRRARQAQRAAPRRARRHDGVGAHGLHAARLERRPRRRGRAVRRPARG